LVEIKEHLAKPTGSIDILH